MLSTEVFDEGIENLKKNFPDAIFTEFKYQVWLDKLSDLLSDEEFEIAIQEAIFKHRFCPTGEELVSLVKTSERELVLDCWSRCLDAIASRLSLNELDDATQYAISQLKGLGHLRELPIYELHKLKPDFCTHWQKYRKHPVEFRRPTEIIPPEQREFKPEEFRGELSEEQKARNEELRKRMLEAVSFNKKLKNNGAAANDK